MPPENIDIRPNFVNFDNVLVCVNTHYIKFVLVACSNDMVKIAYFAALT